MKLFPAIKKKYTGKTPLGAPEAQRQAEFLAWAPVAFQVCCVVDNLGILKMLRNSSEGLTIKEIAERTKLSEYAVKVLLEASLSIGTVFIEEASERFTLSKVGWFLLCDPAVRVNMAFNRDINYNGMPYLEEALKSGKPAGLKTLGPWPTIYEGLAELGPRQKKSWFDFDHFYSDSSFEEALDIVFSADTEPLKLLDIGGNTGRFALKCIERSPKIEVTVADLKGQIGLMEKNIGKAGAKRIKGCVIDVLDPKAALPQKEWDIIWMSQFLDCFSKEQIVMILKKAKSIMSSKSTLYIMETFWDRQRFEPAALCLTLTTLYFTVMANGNSKMYHSSDFFSLIEQAGLKIENIFDHLGQGHTILKVKL